MRRAYTYRHVGCSYNVFYKKKKTRKKHFPPFSFRHMCVSFLFIFFFTKNFLRICEARRLSESFRCFRFDLLYPGKSQVYTVNKLNLSDTYLHIRISIAGIHFDNFLLFLFCYLISRARDERSKFSSGVILFRDTSITIGTIAIHWNYYLYCQQRLKNASIKKKLKINRNVYFWGVSGEEENVP